MSLVKCNYCGNLISDKLMYCSYCGNALHKENSIEKQEIISLAEKMHAIVQSLVAETGNIAPTAIIFSRSEEMQSLVFTIKNDGIEEDIEEIAKKVKYTKDFYAVVLISEIWIGNIENKLRPFVSQNREGIDITILSKSCVISDRAEIIRVGSFVQFGEFLRTELTSDDIGVYLPIYKEIKEMKAIQNTERFTYDTIIGIVNYVKENYSKSPETEDVSQMEITWHLLLHEAISMFNNEEKRYAACSIFVWLEKQKNEVNSNIIRVLYYFLGLMNRYGIGIKENKFLAIEYFRKCIGDSGSKTGFISYRKGEDLPIEMLICSLDNFIEKAKIELGKIF